ncbi:hypothetical protein C4565_01220 [Candidatus Parcubacteria bacterium]|jgi:hypothetical protein|nr:MAG: hypothetical protein C4565_01220 [Candidatus Parcubacteria bacterium]
MHFFSKKTGSVLIEAMVGLSLVIFSFGGIIALVSRGFQLNTDALNKFVAVNLATEGIEIIKNSLDTNLYQANSGWNTIRSGMYELDYTCDEIDAPPCSYYAAGGRSSTPLKRDSDGTYAYDSGVETTFKRSVVIDASDGDSVKVYSIVRWDNRGTEEEVQISDVFFRWRKDPN